MASTTFPSAWLLNDLLPHRHIELLSQGEVRPGVKQGQHWGVPPSTWTEPTPPLVPRIDVNTEIR